MSMTNIGVRVWQRTVMLDAWGRHEPKPVEVTIEIDVDKLMTGLGNKALRNKSRTSRQFGIKVITKEKTNG